MTEENNRTDEATGGLLHGGKVMPLWEHLGELRGVLVKSLIAVVICFFGWLGFANYLIVFLKQPLIASFPDKTIDLHFTGPMDVFMMNIKIAFVAGIITSAPVWSYQFWSFFEPALYPRERKLLLPFALASVLLFFAGVAFCYYLVIPMGLQFLIRLGLEVGTPMITINDYLSFVTVTMLGFGIVFETPLILVLLALLEIVDAKLLSKSRGTVGVIILVASAILTPSPDPLSQISMALPLYIMFELAIVIIRLIEKQRSKNIATQSV